MTHAAAVCVIITARDAHSTIGKAVGSALAEAEVGEVIVIDDVSSDGTAQAAQAADDGTDRLRIIRLDRNIGPAAARNLAIAESRAPILAILDADDFFVPGRLAALLAHENWDAAADNIIFMSAADAATFTSDELPTVDDAAIALDLETFIRGNISTPGKPRGELGFMKPLIRRAFLDAHGLRYDERLRLGEDFILYAQMLAKGARFRLSRRCGYVAVERPGSLSGRHRTADLEALLEADDALIATLSGACRAALASHRRQLAVNARYRRLIDDRHQAGIARALLALGRSPGLIPPVLARLLRDKLFPPPAPPRPPRHRYLLS